MNIKSIGKSIVFEKEDRQYVFPCNTIIVISNDESDLVNIRLKASRKNILQFPYTEVENIESESANDLVTKINSIIYK